MTSEREIEAEIVAKGKTAPRITPSHIDGLIKSEYFVFPADWKDMPVTDGVKCLTICIMELNNGFTVTGESACASPENFDREIGAKIARENARNNIWQLEGYLLKQRLADEVAK